MILPVRTMRILDFRGVTRLFADPEFDGDPVIVYEPENDDPIVPPVVDEDHEGYESDFDGMLEGFDFEDDGKGKRTKYFKYIRCPYTGLLGAAIVGLSLYTGMHKAST